MGLSFANGDEKFLYPVYLNISNSLIVDYEGGDWFRGNGKRKTKTNRTYLDILKAKREGCDGLIIKNVRDRVILSDHYIVFSPEQIKSVYNQGTWDKNNPNIYYQKGLVSQLKQREGGPKIADDSVQITPVKVDKSVPHFEDFKKLKNYLFKELQILGDVKVKSAGTMLHFGKDQVKRGLKKGRSDKHNQFYADVKNSVENAQYGGFIKANKEHPNVSGQDVYYTALQIPQGDKTVTYAIQIKADVLQNHKENVYSYAGHSVEIIDTKSRDSDTGVSPVNAYPSTISIADFKQIFKPKEEGGQRLWQRKARADREQTFRDRQAQKEGSKAADERPSKEKIEKDVAVIKAGGEINYERKGVILDGAKEYASDLVLTIRQRAGGIDKRLKYFLDRLDFREADIEGNAGKLVAPWLKKILCLFYVLLSPHGRKFSFYSC